MSDAKYTKEPLTTLGAFPGFKIIFSTQTPTYIKWYEVATIGLMIIDLVFAVFQALDVVDYGLNLPWFQFGFSLGLAVVHNLMFVIALIAYQWERVSSFTYRWVLSMLVNTGIAWMMFIFFAVWVRHFGASREPSTDRNMVGLISWLVLNAVGVVMFVIRMTVLAMVCGMWYSHLRTMELVEYGIRASFDRSSLAMYLNPKKRNVRFNLTQPLL